MNEGHSDMDELEPKIKIQLNENECLWTVEEIARYLSLKPDQVRDLSRKGILPAIKIGRLWRYRKNMLDQWLEQQMVVHYL